MIIIASTRKIHLQPLDAAEPLCGHRPADVEIMSTDRILAQTIRELGVTICSECDRLSADAMLLWRKAKAEKMRR